jgi:hypothetical protein
MVKNLGSVLAVVGCFALSVPAFADVAIYDNGPINGTISGFNIAEGFAVSDSFTVSNATTVTGVTFGDWAIPDAPPSTVEWSIGSSEEASDLGSGAGNLSNSFFGSALSGSFDIYSSTFSIPNISLAAGTYWLTLSNSSPDPQYWDVNNGPSAAFQNGGTLVDFFGSTSSESFEITGQAADTVTPEPSFQIVGAGLFACIGAGAWLRRRKMMQQAKS